MIAPTGSRLVSELQAFAEADLGHAIQAFVARDGHVLVDLAFGTAGPDLACETTSVFNLYCGLKPPVLVALIDALGEVDLDEQLVELFAAAGLHAARDGRECSIVDLLTHNAGLSDPTLLATFFLSEGDRASALRPELLASGISGGDAAYSEVAAWTLFAEIVSRLSGRPALEIVSSFLARVGLEHTFVARDLSADERAQLGCYYDLSCAERLPLLHDRLSRFTNQQYIALGGYAAIGDVGRWLIWFLDACSRQTSMTSLSPAYLRKCLTRRRVPVFDRTLRRECGFAVGHLIGLSDHGFGPLPSPDAFGVLGFMGNSFAFAEPESGLVGAAMFTGLDLAHPEQSARRRAWITHLIYEEFGGQ